MQTDSTTSRKKRGRKALSPNGLDCEMRRASKHRQRKKHKLKASRRRTEMRKRCKDKLRRARRKQLRRRRLKCPLGQTVRRRWKAVRYYQHWCERLSEREAAERAGQKYDVSKSTIRRWEQLYRTGGLEALLPKPPGPKAPPQTVSLELQFLIVALRRLYGWNEKRMAEELDKRGIAKISHTTIGRIFARYHLPTRTYHSKARCDGIPKQRYEKTRPNQQWHIDFAESQLVDGTRVVIIVLIDDYSRYCLRCKVTADMTAETAVQVVQEAWQAFGLPAEIVSDNGPAFNSKYEQTPTIFGETLRRKGIQHRLTTPYYPEGNGKAEAFVKILKRECLTRPFASLAELEQALAEFVTYYNHVRLHGSLAYEAPVTRYLAITGVRNHGLAGLPFLPEELVAAFPPARPLEVQPVNQYTIKQRFALVPVNC
jgi:transposase InsO family protein